MDFLMKPSRAQRWWDWIWFSTTGIQQLHQDQHLLQTVGMGRTRWHQLWSPDAASDSPSAHITSPATEDCYDRWSQSHGLNELSGHFRVMIHRLREWYLETGEVVVINWTMGDLGMT